MMYLIGLTMGLLIYVVTYVFGKDITIRKRTLSVLIAGILVFLGSTLIIGGFEGIPFAVLSLGIISTAILCRILGKNKLWMKIIYTVIMSSIVIFFVVIQLTRVDYFIAKKTPTDAEDEVDLYLEKLQNDPMIKGYKTFTISEGDRLIVLSLGAEMAGNNIEVLDVNERSGLTEINIRTFYNQSLEKNPFIMLVLNRVQDEIIIKDTDGTIYDKVTEEN